MPHISNDQLHVIAVIMNPIRYKSRYALYEKFHAYMHAAGVDLWTVELAFGDRPFLVTQPDCHRHIQLRTLDELWHKENLINVALSYLPPDWKYVAWIDADIEFKRADWVSETLHQLQHYQVVQMWETCVDLGPQEQVIATHNSFIAQYAKGRPYCYGGKHAMYYEQWHPGYAWAACREALEGTGGLIDFAILGAGDNHMAHALVGKLDFSAAKGLHPNYYKQLLYWQQRAERCVRRDVGYLPGTIFHHWHGKKRDRKYHDRWRILLDHQFDPAQDLKRDSQGVYTLHDHGDVRSIRLRDDIRRYFRVRNEDSIDLD